jgi:hypothetical protein
MGTARDGVALQASGGAVAWRAAGSGGRAGARRQHAAGAPQPLAPSAPLLRTAARAGAGPERSA